MTRKQTLYITAITLVAVVLFLVSKSLFRTARIKNHQPQPVSTPAAKILTKTPTTIPKSTSPTPTETLPSIPTDAGFPEEGNIDTLVGNLQPSGKWNWEELKKGYKRAEQAKPIIARMKEKFGKDLETVRIKLRHYYCVEYDGLPKASSMQSTVSITIRPFQIYERMVPFWYSPNAVTGYPTPSDEERERHQKYEKIKITTPMFQFLKTTDADGSRTEERTNMMPDPIVHGGLPGIESVFRLWDEYGASLGDTAGTLQRMKYIGSGPAFDLPFVEIENIIGKTILCEWPEDLLSESRGKSLPGNILTAEEITWRLNDYVISDRVDGWTTFRYGERDIAMPQNYCTYIGDTEGKEWKLVRKTEFVRIEFDVPIDESLFTDF